MRRDGRVKEISNEVCWTLASGLGPYTDCSHLEAPVEQAVWLCMLDSPHGLQTGDSRGLLAHRIRVAITGVLRGFGYSEAWINRLADEIERSVYAALGPSPAEKTPAAPRPS